MRKRSKGADELATLWLARIQSAQRVWEKVRQDSEKYRESIGLKFPDLVPGAGADQLGLDVPPDVEVRVWDSTAASRYFVLPVRPAGTEGLSERQLAELVTRDAMIGVARVPGPGGEQTT